jgi:hypothetical protein
MTVSMSRLNPASHSEDRWPARATLALCGVPVALRATEAGLLEPLLLEFPPGCAGNEGLAPDRVYSIWRDGQVRVRRGAGGPGRANGARSGRSFSFTGPEVAAARIAHDIHTFVAEQARQRVFVHAGAVAWQGRAIVLPGRSFAGKSTLVAALLRKGAEYLSDEFAVFDGRGYVHPFARPLSIRSAGGEPARRVTASELGANTAAGPMPLGLVAITRFEPGGRWTPAVLSPAAGTMRLIANTLAVRARPEETLRILGEAVRGSTVIEGPRGEAAETADQLLRIASELPRV